MNKICGIYKITSPSGKIYIGQSKHINSRKSYYNSNLGKGQPRIHNSILKYGWNNHTFEILHECQESELNNLEKHYIKFYDSFNTKHGLNLTEGGHSNIMLDEIKRKISNSIKGIKRSDETKQKISTSKKGIHHSKTSNETKQKISNSLKGIKRSEKTLQKMKICKTGLKHTDETKRKISKSKCGTYKIYNQNNEIIYEVYGNIKKALKRYNFPEHTFCNTYKNGSKIKNGNYRGWYVKKL